MKQVEKTTQGHQKMLQLIEDLVRNKHFAKSFKKYLKLREKASSKFTPQLWEKISSKYAELAILARKSLKKYQRDYDKTTQKMAEGYGLDHNLLNYVLTKDSEQFKNNNPFKDSVDMCFLEDGNDVFLIRPYEEIPLVFDPLRKHQWDVYPISLRIHKFASKRDVLDYIEKNWERIYECLGTYTDYKKIRIRKRKRDRKIIDFIWTHRNHTGKEIKKLLDKNFPNNGIIYYEIPKIINLEKKRRLEL